MTPRSKVGTNVCKMLSLPVIALCFLAVPGLTRGGLASEKHESGEPTAAATVAFDVCVRDDSTHNTLQFSSTTGAYMFTRCKDSFTVSGTGTARKSGSVMLLNDKKPDRIISASFLVNQQTGQASLTLKLGPGSYQSISLSKKITGTACGCP